MAQRAISDILDDIVEVLMDQPLEQISPLVMELVVEAREKLYDVTADLLTPLARTEKKGV